MRGLFSQDSTPEERAEGMKKMTEARKAGLTKAEAKLNDEQQKTWKELLGAPFTIVYPPRPSQLRRIGPRSRSIDGQISPRASRATDLGGISDHRAGDLARFRLRMKTHGRQSSPALPISQ